MPDVRSLALRFRRALLEREARAQAAMLAAYEAAWREITAQIEQVTAQIQEAGADASPAQLFQAGRLKQLQDQLAEAISNLAEIAAKLTTNEQQTLINLAREHTAALVKASTQASRVASNFARLPTDALIHLVSAAQDGSPVSDLFADLARQMGLASKDVIKDSLVQGVTLGWNPRRIAAHVRQQVDARGDNPQRDPAIVRRLNTSIRQQTLGAYREATRLSYERNKNLLGGWRWTAARSPQTCVICWAMDGEVFPADAPMDSHIACRCVMTPVVADAPVPESGPQAFAQLEPGYQRQILGDEAFRAYTSGRAQLSDFVGVRVDERWGAQRYRRSLKD